MYLRDTRAPMGISLPTAPKPSAANLALLGVGLVFAYWVLRPKNGRR